MLVRSFDQIVSRISVTSGDSIAASFSAARSCAIRALGRSSHSPIRSRLRSGERLAATPGAMISLDENTTPPTIRSFGIAARRRPPGSRKARSGTGGCFAESPISYHQGMPFCANTTAVSSPSRGCRPVSEAGQAGRLQCADDDILRSERGGIVRCAHLGLEFGVSDAQREAIGLHRIEMRAPHHAGNIMPCQREPHRKMAADGARTENAYPHVKEVLLEGMFVPTSFHKPCSDATGPRHRAGCGVRGLDAVQEPCRSVGVHPHAVKLAAPAMKRTCSEGTRHVKTRTGNCRHCFRHGVVRGGLCDREGWPWWRSRRWPRRRSSWRWPSWRRSGHHFGGRHHGGGISTARRITVHSPRIVRSPRSA